MARLNRKRFILIGAGIVLLALVIYGFLPDPIPVEVATVTRGPMQVVVEEEGTTMVENRYIISSPIAAFAQRINLEVGDPVTPGQVLVRLEPPRATILDPRTSAEAQARVRAAEAAVRQAQQQVQAAEATARQAENERARQQRLFDLKSTTQQALDQAISAARQAQANVEAARAAVAGAQAELAAARVALQPGGGSTLGVRDVLRSPVAGRVLAVQHKSEGMVAPGEPLLEVGTTGDLQVRVEVLSQEAVNLKPGTRVQVDEWGGGGILDASVTRVEPSGFTKVSSLGVEEQRVVVVSNITSPPGARQGLGAGYRVLARFIVWEGRNVVQVPTSALFRAGAGDWAVFAVEQNRATLRQVRVGQQTGLTTQILSGLRPGESVIVHPENAITGGTRVKVRE